MKKYFILLLVIILSIPSLYGFNRFFSPSVYGIASGYTLTSFSLSPTVGIYMPSGNFPPSLSFSQINYTEEEGNFRESINNKSINYEERNCFRGVKSSILAASYGSFSIYRITLNNVFAKYNLDSFDITGFKGTVYGASYSKGSTGFNYGISIKRYSGDFYSGELNSLNYYKNYNDFLNHAIEKRNNFDSDEISFTSISGSFSLDVYNFLKLSLKISPFNSIKLENINKKIEPTYEGGLNILVTQKTSLNLSMSLKKENMFLYDKKTQPIKLSLNHFFIREFFVSFALLTDLESEKFLSPGSNNILSGGIGYIFGRRIYLMLSSSISSWNKLSSLNLTIAYISL